MYSLEKTLKEFEGFLFLSQNLFDNSENNIVSESVSVVVGSLC